KEANQSLPPKTCTIDKLITIPADIEKVLKGKKTATRRNGRYADIGEEMTFQNKTFRIENVFEQTLGELTDEDAKREGYKDLEHYKNAILSIQPDMPWVPKIKVWVHEFRLVE